MPVNFLTDGEIIKGYNEAGRLVAVYDMYENYAAIEYEKYYMASQSGYLDCIKKIGAQRYNANIEYL